MNAKLISIFAKDLSSFRMACLSTDIITRLKKEIFQLQGLRSTLQSEQLDFGLEFLNPSFPNGRFPTGAIHEFVCPTTEEAAASAGFISGLTNVLMQNNSVCFWISSSRLIFPPVLKFFNVDPGRIIFVDVKKEKELLWTMEECLKCDGLASVVCEINEISFIASRRLQLAVEQSGVTGFILRNHSRKINTIASVSRWKIKPIPSGFDDDLPGPAFPRWQVDLLKIRNGKPGSWQIEWIDGKFHPVIDSNTLFLQEEKRKTG